MRATPPRPRVAPHGFARAQASRSPCAERVACGRRTRLHVPPRRERASCALQAASTWVAARAAMRRGDGMHERVGVSSEAVSRPQRAARARSFGLAWHGSAHSSSWSQRVPHLRSRGSPRASSFPGGRCWLRRGYLVASATSDLPPRRRDAVVRRVVDGVRHIPVAGVGVNAWRNGVEWQQARRRSWLVGRLVG